MQTECYASTGQTCDDGQTCGHGLSQTQSKSTSSAAGFPVRIFPTPDEGQDLKGSGADCFSKPFAWFANCDPDALCWKTWQRCLLGGWTEFSGRWPRSGLMRNGIAYRLRPLVPRILGTGFSFWPTPRAMEVPNGKNVGGGLGLTSKVLSGWIPTPTASASKGCGAVGTKSWEHDVKKGNLKGLVMEEGSNGQLNPTWVEWLMGFPEGWTDCEGSETQ